MKHIVQQVIMITFLAIWGAGCVNIPRGFFGAQRGKPKKEVIRESEKFFNKSEILVLDIAGVVNRNGSSGMGGSKVGMLVEVVDKLKAAEGNKKLKGLVLKINSPGGGVTASDLIYHEIIEFKKRMGKKRGKPFPVVAIMEDVAASGGVYIAMAADEVYALPTTITGSIGVIASWPGLQGLSDKIGIEMRVIKSADKKDIGSPWRDMTAAEKAILQDLIDRMYQRFVGIVLDSRKDKGLSREALLKFADGRVFDGATAVENKLIDGVDYLDEVLDRTMALADCPTAAVVSYEYPFTYRGNIYARGEPVSPQISLGSEINLIKAGEMAIPLLPRDTRFQYLWLP